MTNKSHREKLDKKIEMVGMTRKNITPDDVETRVAPPFVLVGVINIAFVLKFLFESHPANDEAVGEVVTLETPVPPDVIEIGVTDVILVNAPVLAVVLPIDPGLANVAPPNVDEFKFATWVVLATVNGAVPVDKVLVITPVAEIVVKAPDPAVILPILPGLPNDAPFRKFAFKFDTTVVLETVNGEVPVDTVETSVLHVIVVPENILFATESPPDVVNDPPFKELVASVVKFILIPPKRVIAPTELLVLDVVFVNVTIPLADIVVAEVPLPIAPGLLNVFPFNKDAFKFAMFVVLEIDNGDVPVVTVLVITLLAEIVVNDADDAVELPIDPGFANVAPFNVLEFKLATFVVLATVNGAVPVDTVLVNTSPIYIFFATARPPEIILLPVTVLEESVVFFIFNCPAIFTDFVIPRPPDIITAPVDILTESVLFVNEYAIGCKLEPNPDIFVLLISFQKKNNILIRSNIIFRSLYKSIYYCRYFLKKSILLDR